MKRSILLTFCFVLIARFASAQPQVAYITPDEAAAGMTVAVEIIAPVGSTSAFGSDQKYEPGTVVQLVNASDNARVTLGPAVVSWNGRMIQQMILVHDDASLGVVPLKVVVGSNSSSSFIFTIIVPDHVGLVTGGGIIGQNSIAGVRPRNTLVVDSLILQNGTYTVSQLDPDVTTAGNQSYLPLRILSRGPIRLLNAVVQANGKDASTGNKGGDGGPGGGGGGSGYPGSGGDGYTGGGGEGENGSPGSTHGGVGSGSVQGNSYFDGGKSLNGVSGGSGMEHNGNSYDEGGGGGTGHPFGTSGSTGGYSINSPAGGYGAGSGGGSVGTSSNYGGGGAGNYTAGTAGQGTGNNAGLITGNPMLLPLAGGSGGGSGNTTHVFSGKGGSGGGGGGAIEFTSFQSFTMPSTSISVAGGNGSGGSAGFLESGAGGAGGSGGAIEISARDSIVIGSSSFSPAFAVNGGNGGSGTASNSNGGSGGVGRVRLNGYVSRINAAGNVFSTTRDYVGPSIQQVTFTKSNFTVSGFAASWDGNPSVPTTITVYYFTNSFPNWQQTTATTSTSILSHTSSWQTSPIALPTGPNDSVLYVVALQPNQAPSSGSFTDVPTFTMSHTSGIIAKVPGLPKVKVVTTVMDFGKERVGQCGNDTTFLVYSNGKADLTVDSLQITGADAAEFSVKTLAPKIVKIGDSLAIVLAYCPQSYKCPEDATLHVFTNDVEVTVALTGCAIEPQFASNVSDLDFGKVRVGTCKDSTITVTDTGTGALTITSAQIGNPAIASLTPLPITIQPGASATLQLEFCPKDTSAISTDDSIVSDAMTSPDRIRLHGVGTKGYLQLPTALDFGSVREGTCRDSSFYAVNVGNDSVTISNLAIADPRFKLISPALPISIAEKDSARITIEYCPTDSGNASASASISTPGEADKSVLLTAFTGRGALHFVYNTIDFGGVEIGGCRDTLVPVTNSGTDTLIATGAGVMLPPFTLVAPTPIVLAPGASVLVDFRYCPTDSDGTTTTGPLSITGPGTSEIFTLQGHGIRGALTTSGPVDFGCIILGSTVRKTISVTNTGTAPISNIQTVLAGSSDFVIVHNSPSTLAIGADDSVVIELTATAGGNQSATLTFNYGSASSVSIPLTAHITPPPAVTLLEPNFDFDTVEVGDTSSENCYRVTNYSCQAIDISKLSITGTDPSSFKIMSVTGPTLLSDSSITTVCISFIPHRNGDESGTLVIQNGNVFDTLPSGLFAGHGHSPDLGVDLSIDSVSGRSGEVVLVPVRANNDVTTAGISSITFRVTFDPMQLDLRTPQPLNAISGGETYSVKEYSLGDQEITVTSPTPYAGKPVIAKLPFEVLIPTASTASLHMVSASFGLAPAILGKSSDGEIAIQQCDSTERVALSTAPVSVAQNSPNPFNPVTSVTLDVRTTGHVRIVVYDVLGTAVLIPFNAELQPGQHNVLIDASALPSGAYHYVTEWSASGYQPTRDEKTMVVVK